MDAPKKVGDWEVGDFINAGKSASVYCGRRGDQLAAVKIFSAEIVQKYGKDAQLGRIRRELSLIGLRHPNLVRILDGGECPDTGLLFVVMELIDAPNLATVLTDVPRDRISQIIAQVADAAQFLESHRLVHRDIKPDNIAISRDFSHSTLLDLGVLRPVGIAELTDDETQRHFLGTLRYSPPEYLLREERDDLEGWRAVTFYQLGAVLHDLLMQRRLFGDIIEPYARLVQAVERDIPEVRAADVPADLVFLARNCLLKDVKLRLKFVSWKHFEVPLVGASPIADLKERIRNRRVQPASPRPDSDRAEERDRLVRQKAAEIQSQIQSSIRRESVESGLFPPVKIVSVENETPESACTVVSYPESMAHGLAVPLNIWIRLTILDAPSTAIQLEAWALTSRSAPETLADPPVQQVVFNGVNDETIVRLILQHLLYVALDGAQQLAAHESAEGYAGAGQWLKLTALPDLKEPSND